MNAEIFALCDAATVDAGGKINILGAFDTINHVSEPIMHPGCAVAIKIRFRDGEEGDYQLRLAFTDPEGNPALPPLEIPIPMQFGPGELTATLQMVLQIPQLILPNFGEYSLDLSVGANALASLPLFARRVLVPPPGPH